jgi:adenosine deaminase CECR1
MHPAVVESAVVATPDPERLEVVKAFIVLTSDHAGRVDKDALAREIQDFCKQVTAPYKYPRRIEFAASLALPRTISGKIKRAELRKMERDLFRGKL